MRAVPPIAGGSHPICLIRPRVPTSKCMNVRSRPLSNPAHSQSLISTPLASEAGASVPNLACAVIHPGREASPGV